MTDILWFHLFAQVAVTEQPDATDLAYPLLGIMLGLRFRAFVRFAAAVLPDRYEREGPDEVCFPESRLRQHEHLRPVMREVTPADVWCVAITFERVAGPMLPR